MNINETIPKKPKFAVLDMGSNSIRLCIFDDFAKGENRKIKYIETCQMGEGFHANLEIQAEPFDRSIAALEKFVDICKKQSVSKIYAFATATVREAKNRDIFISACKKIRLDIHILSGEQEALCGFLGACDGGFDSFQNSENSSVKKQKDFAVIDIGGASTEIAIGKMDGFKGLFPPSETLPSFDDIIEKASGTCCGVSVYPLKFSHSFKLGAVRLTDMFGEDFASERVYAVRAFEKFANSIKLEKSTCLGIGGTITSICGLLKGCENFKPELHGFAASTSQIRGKTAEIQGMTKAERQSLPYLKDKRKNIIPAGGEILSSCLETLGGKNITASLSDNLEGYRRYLGI